MLSRDNHEMKKPQYPKTISIEITPEQWELLHEIRMSHPEMTIKLATAAAAAFQLGLEELKEILRKGK